MLSHVSLRRIRKSSNYTLDALWHPCAHVCASCVDCRPFLIEAATSAAAMMAATRFTRAIKHSGLSISVFSRPVLFLSALSREWVYVLMTTPSLFSTSSSQKASSGNRDCCNNSRGSGRLGLPSFPQHDSQVSECVFVYLCVYVCVCEQLHSVLLKVTHMDASYTRTATAAVASLCQWPVFLDESSTLHIA